MIDLLPQTLAINCDGQILDLLWSILGLLLGIVVGFALGYKTGKKRR